jgi:hypothetical protein
MNKPKIYAPQELPVIFDQAREEPNWLIFAIGKADEKGKRPKRPVARDNPYIWVNRDKAASFTLDKALERMKVFADGTFGSLEDINRKAEERRQDQIAEGKKPGPEIEVEGYALGYFPREGSSLVALDFDNVVEGGVVLDFELAPLVEASGAYVEVSSSGTGLRVFMPRVWGDESYQAGEKNNVGFFVSDKGAACALTFDVLRDGVDRDDALLDLARGRHGAAERRERADSGEVTDQVLEHGRIEVDTFLGMIGLVENDERFEEFDAWLGMVRSAREYFEIVAPDRLDEVRDAVEAWCETWEGNSQGTVHDPEKFEEVWERRGRDDGKASIGSWVHYAQEAGWTWPDEVKTADRWDNWPAPPPTMETPEDFAARFVLVNGVWFDRLHNRDGYSIDQIGNLISELSWPKVKVGGKSQKPNAAQKYDMARRGAQRFSEAAFMPGAGQEVLNMRPTPTGALVPCEGSRVLNLWRPLEVSEIEEPPTPWIEHVRRLYGAEAEHLIDMLAFAVQNPGEKWGYSPILIGPQGCGKDTIIWPVVNAFARMGQAQGNLSIDAMEQSHNGWLETALLVVMQESVAGRMTKANVTEKLKTLIAAPPDTLPLRKMRADIVQVPNRLNLVFLTNHIDTIYMEDSERRFWPISTEEVPEEAHFERLWGWLKSGGAEAVISYLARRPVRMKARGRAPESQLKREVVAANLPEGAEDVLGLVEGKRWVSTKHIKAALTAPSEFGGVGLKISDRNLAVILKHAGFKKLTRVSVRTEAGIKEHHPIYVSHLLNVTQEEIYTALAAGEPEIAKSQRCLTLVGETGVEGGTDKIL